MPRIGGAPEDVEDAEETVYDVRQFQKTQPGGQIEAKFVITDNDIDAGKDYYPDDEEIERCGIACFKPDWLQKFRNMKTFLAVFIVAGLTQGMFYMYWNMTLSSIEKRFQIPSRTTGIITAINDVSHIAVVLLVAHFCGKGHRPRWLAIGSFVLGISVLIFATPELFAPKWDADTSQPSTNLSSPKIDKEICLSDAQARDTADKCDDESRAARDDNSWALILLGFAQVMLGIATTAPIVLAMPFIDDNVKVKNAPIYFALGICGRFVGPLIGVFVGSYCLSTYVDLSKKPNIPQSDPRWMGAWYLGFIIIGCLICATSFLYWFFPKSLGPHSQLSTKKAPASLRSAGKKTDLSLKEKFADLPRDLKRLFVNKVFVVRLLNDSIDMLVVSGYFNFAPKYLEFHFRMSPAQAGRGSALASILAIGCGAAVGGLLTRRFKLTPKHVAIGVAISSFLTAICYFFLMMVRCEARNLHSLPGPDEMLLVNTQCSTACNCDGKPFSPVCDTLTQTNYYSPCHAGCTNSTKFGNGTTFYGNCECLAGSTPPQWIGRPSDLPVPTLWSRMITTVDDFVNGPPTPPYPPAGATVKRGFCEGGCPGFWTYVAISASFKFIGMLPFSGMTMLSFRIVEPDLKALSKAVQTFCASLFAFIPGPIIMGALIDSCCRLWNTQACGKQGACLIYDLDSLRYKMHSYVGIIKTAACIMDLYVIWKVKDMKFERPEETKPSEELEPQNTVTGSVKDLTAFD